MEGEVLQRVLLEIGLKCGGVRKEQQIQGMQPIIFVFVPLAAAFHTTLKMS